MKKLQPQDQMACCGSGGAHDVERVPSGGIFGSLEVWLPAQV
jgi:hypothetical protein